ncbi:HD domain-containing phosphohydrolase [Agarilytica rhodophyticola]|uniref:HD domain-containing phosphohydrolase n=1 Tax=Agarilytica rhodophyticola TaxID=1737490 RepID=UPI00131A34BA|nr:HD domain-containing phosphohydrolase [Agarilytica rhodophyticola]
MESDKTNYIPKVLFVDDEKSVLKSLARFGRRRSWEVYTANSGAEGLEVIEEEDVDFDVIVSDMRMPGMTGDIFLTKARELSPNTTRILLTGYSDIEAIESAINNAKIYNYITKPWDESDLDEVVNRAISRHTEIRKREAKASVSEKQNKKLSKLALLLDKQVKERAMEIDQALGLLESANERAEQNFYDSLGIINRVMEWKEGRDSGHANFVGKYGEKVAEKLEFDGGTIKDLKLAAMLHRIGMLCLPDEIRTRSVFNLNPEERELYQQYPVWGEMALSSSPNLSNIAKIVRHHREAVNGTGFPDEIIDQDIPIVSKIIAVIGDFYDAYNGRLEKSISGLEEAKDYISKWVGKRYDTKIANAFWDVLDDFDVHLGKKIATKTRDLKEGMTLDEDIRSGSNALLLARGVVLNETMIKHLEDYERKFNEELDIRVVIKESD